jgi:hypothetical protein
MPSPLCGSGSDRPGVYLVPPTTGEAIFLASQAPGESAYLWHRQLEQSPSTTDVPPPIESVVVPGEWPAGPTFAAVTLDGDVVLADPTSGEVLRTLLPAHSAAPVGDVALDNSGSTVYAATYIDYRGGPLLRLRPGEPVSVIGSAEAVAVSPDGLRLATINGEGYRTAEIQILDADSGGNLSSLSLADLTGDGDLYVRNVEWDASGDRLLVEAGFPEAGSELFLVDPEGSARRIGPPDTRPDGTGWSLGGPIQGERVLVAENCCALDANSYETDSALLEIDTSTGVEYNRIPLGDNFARPSVSPEGTKLIVTDCCGSPDTRVRDDELRPLGGPIYLAVDW